LFLRMNRRIGSVVTGKFPLKPKSGLNGAPD
jgi:hypothetical protein